MALCVTALSAWSQYFTTSEMPNPFLFMEGPPDYRDCKYSVDFKQYFYGKQVRVNDATRAAQIKSDVSYGVAPLGEIFGPIVGYEIIPGVAPRLYSIINQSITTAGLSVTKAKSYYTRMRPCVRFNEAPYSTETLSEMKRSYSYPSSHSTCGWIAGILTAAADPRLQDTILFRGYDYGTSRVLGGMHWQSDVDDARVIATASLARMLTSDTFKNQLVLSRNEANKISADSLGIEAPDYDDEHYFDVDNMPNPLAYLPTPPAHDTATPEMAYDMAQYIWGKSVRDTEVGLKAKFDINTDFDVLVGEFARAINVPITAEYTPTLYSLLQQTVTMSDNACKKAQEYYQRQRPFNFFKEEAYTYENPAEFTQTGSYPATHACRTWSTAIMMAAMYPAMQDTILKVGFDLGQSDVITGINWQSDVDAGRLVTGAVLSRMLSNPNFVDFIQQAQDEFTARTQTIATDEDDIELDKAPANDGPMYTIDGRQATDDTRGIVVGRNKKILRR